MLCNDGETRMRTLVFLLEHACLKIDGLASDAQTRLLFSPQQRHITARARHRNFHRWSRSTVGCPCPPGGLWARPRKATVTLSSKLEEHVSDHFLLFSCFSSLYKSRQQRAQHCLCYSTHSHMLNGSSSLKRHLGSLGRFRACSHNTMTTHWTHPFLLDPGSSCMGGGIGREEGRETDRQTETERSRERERQERSRERGRSREIERETGK